MNEDLFWMLIIIISGCFLSAMAYLAYSFSKYRIDNPLGSATFVQKSSEEDKDV